MSDDLVRRLRQLGVIQSNWEPDGHTYFDHSSGKVSLGAADAFFDKAVSLAREAATKIEEMQTEVEK